MAGCISKIVPLTIPPAVFTAVIVHKKQSSNQPATPMTKVLPQPRRLFRRKLSPMKEPSGKVKLHHDRAKGNCPAARAANVSRLAMTTHQTQQPQNSNINTVAASRAAGKGI